MPDTTFITVIRHGETAWNKEAKCQGHLDSPLTRLGVIQAKAVAKQLSGAHFDALYSSDLGRAMQTAEIIAHKLNLQIIADARLRERNLGIIQGLSWDEFREKFPEEAAAYRSGGPDYVIPGGESIRQRYERAVEFFENVAARHPGGKIIVVTHGGIVESIFRRVLNIPLDMKRNFSLFNAGLNIFSVAGGVWRLETWGEIGRLKDIPALDDI
ncbi:MAG: histidine phosphatase family protein [Bacillota bacterium]